MDGGVHTRGPGCVQRGNFHVVEVDLTMLSGMPSSVSEYINDDKNQKLNRVMQYLSLRRLKKRHFTKCFPIDH